MIRKGTSKLILLNVIFTTAMLSANIMATKLFSLRGIAMPAGVLAYPITFLMTDVINEVFGKRQANRTVKYGFWANILMTTLLSISIKLPPFIYWENQEAYKLVLGSVPRIMGAGLLTYLISQSLDVKLFNILKVRHNGKHLWIRNNVSTIISQLVDSFLFIFLAFYGTISLNSLVSTALLQFGVKAILALIDTPFCYWLVRWAERD
jgi:uncharacterized integral membrane protein (TIGR00697 family)